MPSSLAMRGAGRPRHSALTPLSMQAASSEFSTDPSFSGRTPVRFDVLPRASSPGNSECNLRLGSVPLKGTDGVNSRKPQVHARSVGLNAPDMSAIWALLVYKERMAALGQCLSLSAACSALVLGNEAFSTWRHSVGSVPFPKSSLVRPWKIGQQHPTPEEDGPAEQVFPLRARSSESVQLEGDGHLFEDSSAAATHLRGRGLDEVSEDWLVNGEPLTSSDGSTRSRTLSVASWLTDSEIGSSSDGSILGSATLPSAESAAIAAKEPVYHVLEVTPGGKAKQRTVSRRQLLRTSDLRLRDMRRIDPSLWSTTSLPGILVRSRAILLNLGSLRAIATPENVLVFDQNSEGAQAFLECLRPRMSSENSSFHSMPFELEVVEAALISRTQRLENSLQQVEPRVISLLEVLPNRYTADILEELRQSKQALVELGSKAGALQHMLLELLESQEDIQRLSIMGLKCVRGEGGVVKCDAGVDRQSVEAKEEEIELLLEFYLQRCDSCHGQAEKLLDAAREMEDSISVNLSSRRLEVSRLELLLQVGTFCVALGALVAGIFGMNLRSYLEEHVLAFWFTTAGIMLGGLLLFVAMFSYLKTRRIL